MKRTDKINESVFGDSKLFGPIIYVIDDDISVRESLGNLMRSVGLNVELFASATEFSNNRRLSGPSCLVLDVRLPGMSGLSLQSSLQELGDKTPIIFITGHGDIPMSVRAMKNGALDFLQKPFREQELLDAIHAALASFPDLQTAPLDPSHQPGNSSAVTPDQAPAVMASSAFQITAADTSPRQTLARNIQLGRSIFNWSQAELGAQCKMHRSHISALERAELSVGIDAIDNIAAAFNIPAHVLLMPQGQSQSMLLATFNNTNKAPLRKLRNVRV